MVNRSCKLAALLLMTLVLGCSGHRQNGGRDAAATVNNILSTRTLRVAFINYPPSLTVDPNTKAKGGIMFKVAAEAAAAMELNIDYEEETSFATMIDTLNSGRVDMVVSGIWPSSARALRADFSRAVYYSPVYAYVRSDDSRFDGNLAAADSSKVRIATIDGELSSIVARGDYSVAHVVSLPQQTDVSQLLLQLTAGKADLTFVEPAIAEAFLAKNEGSIRRVAGVAPVRVFSNTFLFRKGDSSIRDAVNIAIVELINSGRIATIVGTFDPKGVLFSLPAAPVSP
jgi:ABC-type amino acid transport substrate-binding protein